MKTSAQELFLQANQYYAKKEYQTAAQLYEKIPHKSAAIWYNMGNCAYKNGNDMQALLYWQRAKKIGNGSLAQDCIYNCNVIHQKMNLSSSPQNILNTIPALAIQILFFCTFSVFLVINRKLWQTKRFLIFIGMAVLVISTGALTFASYKHYKTMHALIMSDESNMFVGPDTGYHSLGQIPKGSTIEVVAKKNGWTKIYWSGNTGWIQNEKIEII